MRKTQIISCCDRVAEGVLYLLFFCLMFTNAGTEIFAGVAALAWSVKRILEYRRGGPENFFPDTPLNKALVVFIFINAVATIYSVFWRLSLQAFFAKELKFLAIYFTTVGTINSPRRIMRFFSVLTFCAILMAADAIAQVGWGFDFFRGYSSARLKASFSNPNNFAGWLILIIPALAGLVAMDWKKPGALKVKMLRAALALLLGTCLFLTGSRGAWLGILIGFVVSGYYFLKITSLRSKVILLRACMLILFIVLLLAPPIKMRIMTGGKVNFLSGHIILKRINSRKSAIVRKKLWSEAFDIIEDFPLIGSGLNTYARVAPSYKSFKKGGIYPHNSFLQMTAETGILGLFSFLWVLFVFFKYAWGYVNKSGDLLVLALMSGILAFLIQSFFDTNLYSLRLVVLFWFMFGMTIAAIRLGKGIGAPADAGIRRSDPDS